MNGSALPLMSPAPSTVSIGCCPAVAIGSGALPSGPLAVANPDPTAYVRPLAGGQRELAFIIDNLTCPACVPHIEDRLAQVSGIDSARVNLTLGRLRVVWHSPDFRPADVASALAELGYRAIPYDVEALDRIADDNDKKLLRCLAVAGFAAMNVMLISVSVWSGHGTDMGSATRDFFHWVSALIALPAIAYAGQPFFLSAWNALRARRVNMDVPISLGVLLATLTSVAESLRSGEHAYFDAAVMLLFFLLIGRYLDQRMRSRTRSVATNLLALKAVAATVVNPDGTRRAVPSDRLAAGMTVFVAPGDRIPADGVVARGQSDIDASLVTGESQPVPVTSGMRVFAGTLPLSGTLEITVQSVDRDTLLGQIVALMDVAVSTKSHHTLLADRAARLYAPVVHLLAASTFAGWLLLGGGWHDALMNAVAVLIITCPCALGLAVPAVQTVAASVLLRNGILLKTGDALERLADVDTVVFDKTGTLTLGRPELVKPDALQMSDLLLAARLAQSTNHPLAQALVRSVPHLPRPVPIEETPGMGVSSIIDGYRVRLGSRAWCDVTDAPDSPDGVSEIWLRVEREPAVRFQFRDCPRPDARQAVAELRQRGIGVELLSGDRMAVVRDLARWLGIGRVSAEARPDQKISHLVELRNSGKKVMMVGDGLNDAPALAAAHVSASPASAADIAQTAADIVFRGERLSPLVDAIAIAARARRRMVENLALAALYNAIAVPLAMFGFVTPLIAAAAMSGSSIIVVANALRLSREMPRARP